MSNEKIETEKKRKICPSCSQTISFPESNPPKICYHCDCFISPVRRKLTVLKSSVVTGASVVSVIVAILSSLFAYKEARKAQEAAEMASAAIEALQELLISSLDFELKRLVSIHQASYEKAPALYQAEVEEQVSAVERLLDNIDLLSPRTGRRKYTQFGGSVDDLITRYFSLNAGVYIPTEETELDKRVLGVFSRVNDLSK